MFLPTSLACHLSLCLESPVLPWVSRTRHTATPTCQGGSATPHLCLSPTPPYSIRAATVPHTGFSAQITVLWFSTAPQPGQTNDNDCSPSVHGWCATSLGHPLSSLGPLLVSLPSFCPSMQGSETQSRTPHQPNTLQLIKGARHTNGCTYLGLVLLGSGAKSAEPLPKLLSWSPCSDSLSGHWG